MDGYGIRNFSWSTLDIPGPAAPAAPAVPAMISFSLPDQGSVADDIWCQRHLRHRMKERQGERPSPRAANVQQTWAADQGHSGAWCTSNGKGQPWDDWLVKARIPADRNSNHPKSWMAPLGLGPRWSKVVQGSVACHEVWLKLHLVPLVPLVPGPC